jgi:hypothetical protein
MRQAHLIASVMREQKSGGHSKGIDEGLQSASEKFNQIEKKNARVAELANDFTLRLLDAINQQAELGEGNKPKPLSVYTYTTKTISGYEHEARRRLYPELDFIGGPDANFDAMEIYVSDASGSRRCVAELYVRTDSDPDLTRKVKMAIYQINKDALDNVVIPGVDRKAKPS